MNGNIIKEPIVKGTIGEEVGEGSGSAKDIFNGIEMIEYLKRGELASTWTAK